MLRSGVYPSRVSLSLCFRACFFAFNDLSWVAILQIASLFTVSFPTALLAGAKISAPSDGTTVAYPSHPHGCTSNTHCSSLSYTGNGHYRIASWSSSTNTVTLTASSAVPARTQVTAVIPIAANIAVPASGVREPGANKALLNIALWDRDPLISTNAADEPFPRVPPASLVPVGYFTRSELSFSSAIPGRFRPCVSYFLPVLLNFLQQISHEVLGNRISPENNPSTTSFEIPFFSMHECIMHASVLISISSPAPAQSLHEPINQSLTLSPPPPLPPLSFTTQDR